MFLRAEIEVNEKGILAAVERVRKAQTVFNNALYELEKELQKTSLKEKWDSEESPQV